MKFRLMLIVTIAALAIALAVIAARLLLDPINLSNFDRIHAGMTERELVQLLGRSHSGIREDGHVIKTWHGRGPNSIEVFFDFRDGRYVVVNKVSYNASFWDRFHAEWDGLLSLVEAMLIAM